jgi:hypothetical protein|tara:strand:+ start:1363 stop:2250 length:888 start_codon:yes stop_codon:yes gene_type:complete
MGAFSVYREGMDRAAVSTAIDILVQSRRPLVIFPEGVISRSNDRLVALMEGTSFIASRAAKKKAEVSASAKVVIHPVAIRYLFRGDIHQTLDPVLSEIEARLTWRAQRELPMFDRIRKLSTALLGLKELEFLDGPCRGEINERINRLVDRLIVPLEDEWLDGKRESNVVARVKKLRIALLPEMVAGEIDEQERARRWRKLADLYLAQQLSCYAPDYVRSYPSVDRYLETVERFEEDITDKVRVHGPMHCIVQVDEPIEVSPNRPRCTDGDPLMQQIEERLTQMLASLAEESVMVS